jgi:hypothetical protein
MASDSIRRGLDWRAFSVLDTYKNERDISISFGSRTSTAISAVGGLRGIHLRRCHHRDSLGGAVHLSRNNGQPQSAKALAGAVSDRDCGCSFPKQRNFPQRTSAFASGCVPDLVVAVALWLVAVDTSAAVRAEGIAVVTSRYHLLTFKANNGAMLRIVFWLRFLDRRSFV